MLKYKEDLKIQKEYVDSLSPEKALEFAIQCRRNETFMAINGVPLDVVKRVSEMNTLICQWAKKKCEENKKGLSEVTESPLKVTV